MCHWAARRSGRIPLDVSNGVHGTQEEHCKRLEADVLETPLRGAPSGLVAKRKIEFDE
jgi:hypothetical protein